VGLPGCKEGVDLLMEGGAAGSLSRSGGACGRGRHTPCEGRVGLDLGGRPGAAGVFEVKADYVNAPRGGTGHGARGGRGESG